MGTSIASLRVVRAFLDDPSGRHYGLGLIEASGVRAGSLYPMLGRLEADGWIMGEWEDIDESAAGRRRRRYYHLTGLGESRSRMVLEEHWRALAPPAGHAQWTPA